MLAFVFVASWFNTPPIPTPKILANQSLKIEVAGIQSGTAVLIDPYFVLSAAHVLVIKNRLAYDKEIKIYCFGVETSAKIVKIDHKVDLVLIRLENECKTVPLTEIAKDNPVFASTVYTVGCPSEFCGTASHGIISGFQEGDAEHGAWMLSDAQVFLGSSGSGLFTVDGELIGICSRIRNFTKVIQKKTKKEDFDVLTAAYSVWVPVSEIRIFLGI
jgi:hypothetical protein